MGSLTTGSRFKMLRLPLLLGLLLLVSIVTSEDSGTTVDKIALPEAPEATLPKGQEADGAKAQLRNEPSASVVDMSTELAKAFETARAKLQKENDKAENDGGRPKIDPFLMKDIQYAIPQGGQVNIHELKVTGFSQFAPEDVTASLEDNVFKMRASLKWPNIKMYASFHLHHPVSNNLFNVEGEGSVGLKLEDFTATIDITSKIVDEHFQVTHIGGDLHSKHAYFEAENPAIPGIGLPVKIETDLASPEAQLIMGPIHNLVKKLTNKLTANLKEDFNENLKKITVAKILEILKDKLDIHLPTLDAYLKDHADAASFRSESDTKEKVDTVISPTAHDNSKEDVKASTAKPVNSEGGESVIKEKVDTVISPAAHDNSKADVKTSTAKPVNSEGDGANTPVKSVGDSATTPVNVPEIKSSSDKPETIQPIGHIILTNTDDSNVQPQKDKKDEERKPADRDNNGDELTDEETVPGINNFFENLGLSLMVAKK